MSAAAAAGDQRATSFLAAAGAAGTKSDDASRHGVGGDFVRYEPLGLDYSSDPCDAPLRARVLFGAKGKGLEQLVPLEVRVSSYRLR